MEYQYKLRPHHGLCISFFSIDKRTALFTEMKFAGREYLNHPMELNIWRAPTDNDMYIKSECTRCGRDSTEDS